MPDRDREFLRELQSMSLGDKYNRTLALIGEWHNHYDNNVYVSLSGGKDSTVLADIDAQWCSMVHKPLNLCFSNTGLEYPEIQRHVRNMKEYFGDTYGIEVNLDVLRPKMRFDEVVSTYGYPLIGKEVAEAIHAARIIRWSEFDKHRGEGKEIIRKRAELLGLRKQKAKPFQQDDGVLSLPKEDDGKKSLFNKKKWLPLAYGTQFRISHYCCHVMKKAPTQKYKRDTGKNPMLGTMTEESRLRQQNWIRYGCNSFVGFKSKSQPLSFWTEQDILRYTYERNLPMASVYGDIIAVDESGNEYDPGAILGDCGRLKCTGCQRTGCIFCGFGAHLEKPREERFVLLAKTHPKQYDYCINGGQWVDNPTYDPSAPEYDGEWKNWNPKKIWVPSKKGLGMGKVFDMCNEIYGKDFIKYE